MKKLTCILAVALAICLLMSTACAQSVRFEGGQPTFPAVSATDNSEMELTAETIILLGITGDGMVEVYANGALAYISREDLTRLVPELETVELTPLREMPTLESGADLDAVAEFQRALIDLGYLEDSADGYYGNMTRTAVSAFQAEKGLPVTGEGDPVTCQLIYSLTEEEMTIADALAPDERLADLIARCEAADMSPLLSLPTTLEYDPILGTGFIAVGDPITVKKDDGADIENYEFTLIFGYNTSESEGVVKLSPRIRVVFTAVRQPMLTRLYLKSGELRNYRNSAIIGTTVLGSRSVDSYAFGVAAATAELLAQAAEAGELQMRLTGKYQDYDFDIPQEQLETIAGYGAATSALYAEAE